jgi:hypothetical protein
LPLSPLSTTALADGTGVALRWISLHLSRSDIELLKYASGNVKLKNQIIATLMKEL